MNKQVLICANAHVNVTLVLNNLLILYICTCLHIMLLKNLRCTYMTEFVILNLETHL